MAKSKVSINLNLVDLPLQSSTPGGLNLISLPECSIRSFRLFAYLSNRMRQREIPLEFEFQRDFRFKAEVKDSICAPKQLPGGNWHSLVMDTPNSQ